MPENFVPRNWKGLIRGKKGKVLKEKTAGGKKVIKQEKNREFGLTTLRKKKKIWYQ